MMREVANGSVTSELNTLKTFCPSLHQALLAEMSPFQERRRVDHAERGQRCLT
jgi:hypothetical protein